MIEQQILWGIVGILEGALLVVASWDEDRFNGFALALIGTYLLGGLAIFLHALLGGVFSA